MQEDEVHSLILERTDEIENDDLRSFINEILTHERSRLDTPRPEYREKYKSLADSYSNNASLEDFDEE
jgi:hypothetical protein